MKNLWEKWKIVAEKIGNLQILLIFSLIYFVLISPLGFIASLFKDFLDTKNFPTWKKMEDNTSFLEKLKLQ
ncbi:hypothetical protein HY404_00820 [Candidatus Microgenomates bacterium]|nr:hypothetical protein [Candidatus Microgenomates bacterium]